VQCSLPVRPCLGSADRASTSLPLECLTPRTPTGQRESEVDSTGCIAVALSAGIILTTIHTQDYKDVLGDAAAGRVTLPIAHPVASRVVTAFILVAWSWGVSLTWQLDGITAAVMGVLALVVGVSFVARRDAHADVVSSYLYNVSQKTQSTRALPSSDAVSHAIAARFGSVPHIYSLDTTGCAGYHDQLFISASCSTVQWIGLGHLWLLMVSSVNHVFSLHSL